MRRKKAKVQRTREGLKIPSSAKKCLSFDEDGDELWEIENIIQQRKRGGKNEYLVKWVNWPYRYCTWEPEESFLEDMSIILNFVKEKNDWRQKKICKHLIDEAKPKKKKKVVKKEENSKRGRLRNIKVEPEAPSKSKSRRRSQAKSTSKSQKRGRSRPTPRSKSRIATKMETESDPETKIVIQRLTVPSTSSVIQMQGTGDVIVKNVGEYPSPAGKAQKMTDVYFCRCSEDTDGSDEKKPAANKRFKDGVAAKDFLDDHDNDSLPGMEEEESEEASEVKSQRSEFSVPLMENELEKISEYKVVVEECFAYRKSNLKQTNSFKFKVAFYDDSNALKGYDFFTYDEIKQKKWDNALMSFYAKELLNEMQQNGKSITSHIKVI